MKLKAQILIMCFTLKTFNTTDKQILIFQYHHLNWSSRSLRLVLILKPYLTLPFRSRIEIAETDLSTSRKRQLHISNTCY